MTKAGQTPPRRILVYGVTGSGKSTLALKLGEKTGLPVHLVDELTWELGWVAVPDDEQRRRIAAIVAGEEWVLDSAYGKWVDLVLPRADLIIGLDYPRATSLMRLILRTARRCFTRETSCNGNQESLRLVFSRESIIAWHFRSFKSKRARMRAWAEDSSKPRVVLLRQPKQAVMLLNGELMPGLWK